MDIMAMAKRAKQIDDDDINAYVEETIKFEFG